MPLQPVEASSAANQALNVLRDVATRVTVARGGVLVGQDERSDAVYFIEDGLCKLVWRTIDGHQTIVGFRPKGWTIGSTYGLLQIPQPFAAEAVARCSVHRVAVHQLADRVGRCPELAQAVLVLHSRELHQAHFFQRLTSCSVPVPIRVQMLLSWLCDLGIGVRDDHDVGHTIEALTYRDMAALVAITPETFSRVIGAMQRQALIAKRKGWITLLHNKVA